jgi:hypothetical protein
VKRILKITGATCLMELQTILHVEGLALKIDYVSSAITWRATLQRNGEGRLWIGVGRTISEAVEDALSKHEAGV